MADPCEITDSIPELQGVTLPGIEWPFASGLVVPATAAVLTFESTPVVLSKQPERQRKNVLYDTDKNNIVKIPYFEKPKISEMYLKAGVWCADFLGRIVNNTFTRQLSHHPQRKPHLNSSNFISSCFFSFIALVNALRYDRTAKRLSVFAWFAFCMCGASRRRYCGG